MKQKIYPWLMVACTCGNMAAAIGLTFNSMGVFFGPMAEDMHVGRGDIAMFMTMVSLISALAGPIVVKLSDKIKIRWMIAFGAVLQFGTYVLMSRAQSIPIVYICGLSIGVCSSVTHGMVTPMVLGNWFNKKMSVATGISACFSGVSGAIFSPLFASLIETSGWRSAYLTMGVIWAVAVIPSILFLVKTPQEVGLEPYGGNEKAAGAVGGSKALPESKANTYVILIGIMSCMIAVLPSFGSHMSGIGTSKGLTLQMASLLASASMIGNMTSKLILGVLMDKIGIRKAMTIYFGIEIVGFAVLLALPASMFPAMLVCAALFGCSYATGAVGLAPFAKEIFGLKLFAQKFSYSTLISSLVSCTFMALIGYAYDWFGTYTLAGVISIVLVGAACVMLQYISARSEKDKAEA